MRSIFNWWLLCLAFVCFTTACGEDEPITGPSSEPVIPHPDLTQAKLLSDEELFTPPLAIEPVVNEAYKDWISDNLRAIRSLTYDQGFSDLQFLEELVAGKRLVQLGESSHGTREFNQVKVRLVKYLHEVLGYNVIAIESGFYEGLNANRQINDLTATELMRFIFGVWNTAEVVELFEYVKETQQTSAPLQLAGFDIQLSSNDFYNNIGSFVQSLEPLDATLRQSLSESLVSYRNTTRNFSQEGCFSGQSTRCDDIIVQYNELIANLTQYSNTVAQLTDASLDLEIAKTVIKSAITHLEDGLNFYEIDGGPRPNLRDEGMADNIQFLMDVMYPDEKIIIWAHNAHITYDQSPRTQPGGGRSNIALSDPMGSFLYEARKDEIYSVGLYMIRGQTNSNSRSSFDVARPNDNSIEALSYHQRLGALFFDVSSDQTRSPDNEFIFQRIPAQYWGVTTYEMILSDQYDGVLVIDRSQRPSYL